MINRNKLEKCSQEQCTLFEKWYNALEDVEADIADEEARRNRYSDKLELRTRSLHPDWKEGHIKAFLSRSSKIRIYNKRLMIMRRYKGRLKGAVESARQRKSMIGVLKDLYTSNYWDKTTVGDTPYGKKTKAKHKIKTRK